ncbi:MAG TPA: hypothetical protein VL625_06390 [Patescibacteria group bacterium]|nr:hypothetical protein [Patescibacteria group bacterium]
MKKSRVLLSAAAFIVLAASPLPVFAGEAQYNPNNAAASVSGLPGMGLSYPTIQAPTAAQPGEAVPYSAQQTLGGEVPAAAAQAPQNNNASTPAAKTSQSDDTKTEKSVTQPPVVVQEYDENGEPYTNRYHKEHTSRMAMVMLRRPELKPSQFVLRLTPRSLGTGCVRVSKIPSTVDFKEGAIEVTLDEFRIDGRGLTLAPEYNCDLHPKNPTADIVLDRDDLTSKGIKLLKLKTGQVKDGQITDTFDVDINNERIRLKPDKMMQRTPPRFKTYQLSNIRAPLTHWFYPEGTVILYVPGAKGEDVTSQVVSMAKAQGLEPLSDEWPDFRSPLIDQNQWYFVDKKGVVSKSPDINGGTVAGTVQITQIVYGLEKDEKQTKDIPVFARKPNSYE